MTDSEKQAPNSTNEGTKSLPFLADAPELLRVRVRPAEFARLLGVSKQCVSIWIRSGKLTLNPLDGRVDLNTAVEQVLRNTDPGRMRARVLRLAVQDVQQLRLAAAQADERVAEITEKLNTLQSVLDAYENQRHFDMRVEQEFFARLYALPIELRSNYDESEWVTLVDAIFDNAVRAASGSQVNPDDADLAELDIALSGTREALDTPEGGGVDGL